MLSLNFVPPPPSVAPLVNLSESRLRTANGRVRTINFLWPKIWKATDGGGKMSRAILGGESYHRVRSFGGLRKWDLPGGCRFNMAKTRGGGKRIIGGGVQNRFLEGVLWYVFPSPEFSTLLGFSLKNGPFGTCC